MVGNGIVMVGGEPNPFPTITPTTYGFALQNTINSTMDRMANFAVYTAPNRFYHQNAHLRRDEPYRKPCAMEVFKEKPVSIRALIRSARKRIHSVHRRFPHSSRGEAIRMSEIILEGGPNDGLVFKSPWPPGQFEERVFTPERRPVDYRKLMYMNARSDSSHIRELTYWDTKRFNRAGQRIYRMAP